MFLGIPKEFFPIMVLLTIAIPIAFVIKIGILTVKCFRNLNSKNNSTTRKVIKRKIIPKRKIIIPKKRTGPIIVDDYPDTE